MRIIDSRMAWPLLVSCAVGTCLVLFTGVDAGSADQEAAKPAASASPSGSGAAEATNTRIPEPHVAVAPESGSGCLVDEGALKDLQSKREELDARAKELAAKEQELQARETALNEEFKKIQEVRDEIAKTEILHKAENEEKVAKLVDAFQSMSPKASAVLLANVDETLAVTAMSRMETAKLSKILNVMEPEKSSRLSERMAGVARAKRLSGSNGPAAATTQLTKGGENNDASNEQSSNSSRSAPENAASQGREPSSQKGSVAGK